MSLLAVATAVALVAVRPDFEGSATCPTPTAVAERLAPLLSPADKLPPGSTLRVESFEREIEIRLERSDTAARLAVRRLAREGSCEELAEAVAVVAASWVGHYETPAPPAIAPWELPGPPAALRSSLAPNAPADAPAPRLGAWSIGAAGGVGAAAAGGVAPQGAVEVAAAWRNTPWFGRLAFAGISERLLALDVGSAGWSRILIAASVGRSWGQAFFVEASLGPAAGPVFVRGRGFVANASDVGLDIGACPALRVGYRFGRSRGAAAWAGASAIAWLRPHRLSVDMSPNGASLPRLDVMTGLGATFAFGR